MSQTELVSISQKAVDKVKEFSKIEEKTSPGLRVYVAGGGCAGLTYGMALEEQSRSGRRRPGRTPCRDGVRAYA